MLIHGRTPDGSGLEVVRLKEDRIELGSVQRVKDGQALTGEVVRLTPRAECPLICDVESQYRAPEMTDVAASLPEDERARGAAQGGPPQVATDRYRQNWDSIWSSKTSRKRLLN